MDGRALYQLIRLDSAEAVFNEAIAILELISPRFDRFAVTRDYVQAVRLYRGQYPGYQPCSTEYHSLFHATHTFLTMARLAHGAHLENLKISHRGISLALSAAVFHDSGYLMEEGDREGTGAKHTLEHVPRGINLFRHLAGQWDYSNAELEGVEAMILCTDLTLQYDQVVFTTPEWEILGKLLDTADLLTQMSDRAYLEKLLFLFHEFREAGIGSYTSEAELLAKTLDFYTMIEERLAPTAELADRCIRAHFRCRRQLDLNPYQISMGRQHAYLEEILQKTATEPQQHLRRDGIAALVKQKFS